jgi:TPR repeat protein
MGRGLLICFLIIVLYHLAACEEDRRADKAYLRGEYDKALVDIQFLAHGGEPRAQYDLGLMYDKGQGVPQSDAKALDWYERAANQGEPRAQYNLGLMHLNGQGVLPDVVKAYIG